MLLQKDIPEKIHKKGGIRRWVVLVAIIAAQLMVTIDISGLNVALPSIQRTLHFNELNLQWVISAYQIIFGSFLLLGGKIADLWGRKNMFLVGTTLFTLTSLLCGLAWSDISLIVFRALQGLAAALLTPTSLSLVLNIFVEERDRNLALGIWGAIFGAGGAFGSVLSGVVTTVWDWTWFFFLNVPLGIFAIMIGIRLIPKDRIDLKSKKINIFSSFTISTSIMLLLYSITIAQRNGWTTTSTIAYLSVSILLLAFFVLFERRSASPLLPLFVVRKRTMRAGIIIGVLAGSYHFSLFFLLTLYMQDVLHLSPLQTSIGYLASAINTVVFANITPKLIRRSGVKLVLICGQALVITSFVYYARLPVEGNYWIDLFPALFIGGIGWGLIFPSINILSFSSLEKSVTGIASGIINMSEQLGGAIGIALIAIIAVTQTKSFVDSHPGSTLYSPDALTSGFHFGYWVLAGLAMISLCYTALFSTSKGNK